MNSNGNWEEYKVYVLEFIKKFSEQVDDLEKNTSMNKIESVNQIYSMKEEFNEKINKLLNSITELQTRANAINTIMTIIISAIVGAIIKVFFNG